MIFTFNLDNNLKYDQPTTSFIHESYKNFPTTAKLKLMQIPLIAHNGYAVGHLIGVGNASLI